MGQFMSLAGSQDEGDCPSEPVGDHAGLRAKATPRAAQRLTPVPLSLCAPFRRAPAAFSMRTDVGAVEERHPELHAGPLRKPQQALPDTQTRPADEGLSR